MTTGASASVTLYSDCPVFGGSDKMAANLLNDEDLAAEFGMDLVYRLNPRFEAGLKRALRRPARLVPVRFPERQEWLDRLEAALPGSLLRLPFKLFLRLADYVLFPFEVLTLTLAFRRLRPDLVHINDGGYPGALGCRAAAIAARLAGARRVVFSVHNLASALRLPWEVIEAFIDAGVRGSVDAFVTASQAARLALIRRGFSKSRIEAIPNGVSRHSPARTPAEMRSALGVPADVPLLVMTAFFEPRKGHRVLVEAARGLAARGGAPDFRCVLIGDGPERSSVERSIAGAGLAGRFLFLGYRADAADILSAADILVLPSIDSEDMPLAVLDAMALGKPVVASALAGIVEEIEDGRTGLLVPPGDPDRLADALGSLLSDPARRRAMGEAGLRRFEGRFEASLGIRAYADLYRHLLGLSRNGNPAVGRIANV